MICVYTLVKFFQVMVYSAEQRVVVLDDGDVDLGIITLLRYITMFLDAQRDK